MGRILVDEMYM